MRIASLQRKAEIVPLTSKIIQKNAFSHNSTNLIWTKNISSKWQYWIKILSIWVVQILGKTLVEEERKYSCLWDKWNKGYKEKDRKVNARNALVEDTGVEQGSRSNYLIFA